MPDKQMPTTQWTLIARLQGDDAEEARRALDELCQAYHYPLYCQLRRHGLPHHDAEDVLHDFLAKLIRLESFGLADAEKGRLRSYLLVALRHFLSNWRRDQRRSQAREISVEALAAMAGAEERFELDAAAHHESPDRLYDRQWAQELIRQVMRRLQSGYAAKGRTALFDALRPVLLDGGSLGATDNASLAARLGMNPGALRTALSRLLVKYRETLRLEILQTVESKELAKEEYATLMAVFERK